MGLSGIAAQIILLRELLISFLGNELTLGIILGNWLILVAIGAFLIGQSVEKVKRKAGGLCLVPAHFFYGPSIYHLSLPSI